MKKKFLKGFQITYKESGIEMASDYSTETLEIKGNEAIPPNF